MGCEKSEKEVEAPPQNADSYIVNLPRSLTLEEKKYLLAVERGDLANVRRILQAANNPVRKLKSLDVNCVDSLGRGALTLAIESENLEMVELLVVMGVETRDALLHSIDQEFVEAVELLLEHEELVRASENPDPSVESKELTHSWQMVDPATARYPTDMTPLVLAAQRNNYEILKLLLDRGATLPMPHDIRCSCEDCLRATTDDPLRLSSTRITQYRALSSPCLIALSSSDPLMTVFQLSWELKQLGLSEPESRDEYTKLRRQVEKFGVDLLQQSRSTAELATILNHDPEEDGVEVPKQLARLEQAIQYKQKRFVANAHVQQLLAAIWYEGVPGFRRMSSVQRVWIVVRTAVLFPFYCLIYLMAPNSKTGQLLRNPFMKFLIHASSYVFFLLILILVSQRAEEQAVRLLGNSAAQGSLKEYMSKQRGTAPSPLEYLIMIYVLGFIWQETREVYVNGIRVYLRDLWNFIDFTRNTLYVVTAILRAAAYIQQKAEIQANPEAALVPRENWGDFDPQLIAEGLFAAANVFSALKLVHLFSINPQLGPLQISMGRMVIDIVKFFFIYTLVLFAFACGLNQLLWYFAELERRKCYTEFATDDTCIRWRRFSNLFESCQSLFWASFGGLGIENFELEGIKSYTRFWGLLMLGSYSVINVIVLLNLLIAMMSNSYTIIEEHSDVEWKFARAKLWMSYFEDGGTLPPPFNIIPAPKKLFTLCGMNKKDLSRRNSARRRARNLRYSAVIRALVWRYVVDAQCQHELKPVTEDDVHELKTDLSSWRCELLELLGKNGMDIAGTDTKDKTVLGRKMRIWERRLMKDFQVAGPMAGLAEEEARELFELQQPPEGEDNVARWKRVARLAVLRSAERRWGQVVRSAVQSSQIGKSNSRASLQSQQSLRRAMEEARRLATRSPLPPISPVVLPDIASNKIIHVLKDDEEVDDYCLTSEILEGAEQQPKPPAAMGYVDEKDGQNIRPLVSLQDSPPRVIKRKAPGSNMSSPRPSTVSSSQQILKVNTQLAMPPSSQGRSFIPSENPHCASGNPSNLEKSAARTNPPGNSTLFANIAPTLSTENSVVRPGPRMAASPKKYPQISVISGTPELGREDKQRLVKIEPQTPRFSGSRAPRGGGWL